MENRIFAVVQSLRGTKSTGYIYILILLHMSTVPMCSQASRIF